MAQPMGDGAEVDSRAEQMDGGAMSDGVRVQALVLQRRVPLCRLGDILLEDQPDAEPGQRAAALVEEHRHRLGRGQTSLLDEPLQEACGLGPERAGPFFPAFAAQKHTARGGQAEITSLHAHDLADAGPRVEHQAQEGNIPAATPDVHFHGLEHRLDFVRVKMLDLTGAGALEWNAKNALDMLQMLGALATQIAKEAVDGTQADVARADLIVPNGFEALQEGRDLFDAQMFHSELAWVAFLLGCKLQ